MQSSGFTNAGLSKYLLVYTVVSAAALAIFDCKHLVNIQVSPHLWQYGQLWRVVVWQVAGFANSTEVLFAAILIYHMRPVERAWGRRKTATFLLATLPYTTLIPPVLLALVVRPLSLNHFNDLPSGPSASLFALLAQYYATIPHTFRYRISMGAGDSSTKEPSVSESTSAAASASASGSASGSASAASATTPVPSSAAHASSWTSSPSLTLLLSDKSTTYLIAAQLALSQFPAMLLPAAVGWMTGLAWRAGLLPGLSPTTTASSAAGAAHPSRARAPWRIPAWMVGETAPQSAVGATGAPSVWPLSSSWWSSDRRRQDSGSNAAGSERFADLRRRLDREAAAAAAVAAAAGEGASSTGAVGPRDGRQRRQGREGIFERIQGVL